MRTVDALRLLAELSASQWGMMTTAQAATLGIKRLELSRLSGAGHLERLAHGVYRDVGAPSDEFEGLRTAWLAADPSRTAEQRLPALSGGVVVMGESAASLHGVGDLPADRHELSTPIRRQSRRPEVNYRHRQLEPGDVTIAYGLPVTTIERTIADLVETRTDLSLVADVLRDAAWARHLDTNRLAEMLGPLAARNGLRKGDGHTLLDHLSTLAGLDTTSLAEEIGTSETLSALVAANSLARFSDPESFQVVTGPAAKQALRGLNESIAQSVAEAIGSALNDLAAPIGELAPSPRVATVLAELAEQVSQNLASRNLLGSFGEEWAAAIESGVAGARTGALLAPEIIAAANSAGLVGSRG